MKLYVSTRWNIFIFVVILSCFLCCFYLYMYYIFCFRFPAVLFTKNHYNFSVQKEINFIDHRHPISDFDMCDLYHEQWSIPYIEERKRNGKHAISITVTPFLSGR